MHTINSNFLSGLMISVLLYYTIVLFLSIHSFFITWNVSNNHQSFILWTKFYIHAQGNLMKLVANMYHWISPVKMSFVSIKNYKRESQKLVAANQIAQLKSLNCQELNMFTVLLIIYNCCHMFDSLNPVLFSHDKLQCHHWRHDH